MKEETKIWLDLAEEDYSDMLYMSEGGRYRGAVFFAQQCVEKIIKAYIAEYKDEIPKKIHRIERLMLDAGLDLSEIDNPHVEELSIAYGWARYRDLSFTHFKQDSDVAHLIVMSKKIYLWIKNKLQSH